MFQLLTRENVTAPPELFAEDIGREYDQKTGDICELDVRIRGPETDLLVHELGKYVEEKSQNEIENQEGERPLPSSGIYAFNTKAFLNRWPTKRPSFHSQGKDCS
jgi:hypothetical protein